MQPVSALTWFTKLGVPFVQLFLPRTPTTTTLPLTLYASSNLSPPTVFRLLKTPEWAKQYTYIGEFMCSFDVSSLFTNVPLDETIEICLDKLYALTNPPRLPRLVLKNLLLIATKKSHFVFDDQYFDQIDWWRRNGLSTWSCLGEHFHVWFWRKLWVMTNINQPTIWIRYAGDTFTLFKNKNDAFSFLHYLNGRHNDIKFTTEFEQNDEIPFLDILLKRNLDSSFSTSIYRKKTFTGLYTKWDSFTPRKYWK